MVEIGQITLTIVEALFTAIVGYMLSWVLLLVGDDIGSNGLYFAGVVGTFASIALGAFALVTLVNVI